MNSYPKKLSIKEVWKLHTILKPSLDENSYLIDEVSSILQKTSQADFLSSLQLMYKNYKVSKYPPVKVLSHFVSGLRKSQFFEFCSFIKVINGRS